MNPAAYAIVNLNAIEHNIRTIRTYAPNSRIMAVIKANAYGHGLTRVASVLKDVDAIAVARADEGIRLRQAGFNARIVLLEGFVCENELEQIIKFNLEIVVHCKEQVDIIASLQSHKKISIWLKLDSGMNRLGFKGNAFRENYLRLSCLSHIHKPISLMTHLSSADDISSDVTNKQIAIFNKQVKNLSGDRSIANSAAIMAYPNAISDWVRPGIMIYGVSPFPDKVGSTLGLEPVMSLHSRLISVKWVNAGESVGYGESWVCNKATRIGVVAIGYGDGYSRYAKTGTPVMVNNKRVSLIGRVSMDMITVDLTSQPDAKPGNQVTLWGNGLAVEEVARYSDTIPYTLLCGITQRVSIVTE